MHDCLICLIIHEAKNIRVWGKISLVGLYTNAPKLACSNIQIRDNVHNTSAITLYYAIVAYLVKLLNSTNFLINFKQLDIEVIS